MARKRTHIQGTISTVFRFLLTSILTVSIGFNPGTLQAQDYSHQARSLTQQGRLLLERGQPQAALSKWQAATQIYRQLGDSSGIVRTSIDQSLALQALGLYPRACQVLISVLEMPKSTCAGGIALRADELPPLLKSQEAIAGWQQLGEVLRHLGRLSASEVVLEQALQHSQSDELRLGLANTKQLQGKQAWQRYEMIDEPLARSRAQKIAQDNFERSLALYGRIKGNPETTLLARLNRLSLLVDLKSWNLLTETQPQIQPAWAELLEADFSIRFPARAISTRLNFARTSWKMGGVASASTLPLVKDALAQARKLNSPRLQSQAAGMLGQLYRRAERSPLAQKYLEMALRQAQSGQQWDLAYQWQWELGRVYRSSGKIESARAAYSAALDSLDLISGNIWGTDLELVFSFQEKIEPVYREYMSLLFQVSDLKEAIETRKRLKSAELENFLRCGNFTQAIALKEADSMALPDVPAIYIINLGDTIEEIVWTNRELHRHTPNREVVLDNLQNLQFNWVDERFVTTPVSLIRSYSQKLYEQLIAPIEQYLPPSGPLVFALDSPFDNLPMGMLHDGTSYLVEKYGISVTLGEPASLSTLPPAKLKALIAAIVGSSPNAAPLSAGTAEVSAVRENLERATLLLDREFTSDRFFQTIEQAEFPIIHVTTHGQFSSDPDQTMILAWDKPIKIDEFHRFWSSPATSPLDLLVLSACQTAKGDKRSALGLAGVAVTTKARSTLASLWRVEAGSTTELMGYFYRGWTRGMTKAEALAEAQKALLANPQYQHPYYWAGWVLVGR